MARCIFLEVLGVMFIVVLTAHMIVSGALEPRYMVVLIVFFYFCHLFYFTIKRILKQRERYTYMMQTGNHTSEMDWAITSIFFTSVILSIPYFVVMLSYGIDDVWAFFFRRKASNRLSSDTIRNPFEKPPPPPPPVKKHPHFHEDVTTYRFRKDKDSDLTKLKE